MEDPCLTRPTQEAHLNLIPERTKMATLLEESFQVNAGHFAGMVDVGSWDIEIWEQHHWCEILQKLSKQKLVHWGQDWQPNLVSLAVSLPDGPGFEGMKESEQWRFGAVRDGSQQHVGVTVIVTRRPGWWAPDCEDIYRSQIL